MKGRLRHVALRAAPLGAVLGVALLGPRWGMSSTLVVVLGVAIAGLHVGISMVAARRRSRAHADLRTALDRVGRGRVTPQVALRRGGELSELVRAFNAMARRVERAGVGTTSPDVGPEAGELLEVLEGMLELSRAEASELRIAELRSALSHVRSGGSPRTSASSEASGSGA